MVVGMDVHFALNQQYCKVLATAWGKTKEIKAIQLTQEEIKFPLIYIRYHNYLHRKY